MHTILDRKIYVSSTVIRNSRSYVTARMKQQTISCQIVAKLKSFNLLENKQSDESPVICDIEDPHRVDHIAKLGPSFDPASWEFPLPSHLLLYGSSREQPSYRIYTAAETANGSFFQASFKEALKGTHRAFDGSEVSAPWTDSIERLFRQELTGEPLRKKNDLVSLYRLFE